MKMYQVDAFSKALFQGNPVAVLMVDDWLDENLMQNIALENNLSETAFFKIIDNENYEIRWFTPTHEIDFCGHATLASSFVIFKAYTASKQIYFHVKKLGTFTIVQEDDGKIRMNFPLRPATRITQYPEILHQALTKPFKNVYLNEQAYIIEYYSFSDLLAEKPNFELLKRVNEGRTDLKASPLDVAITSAHEHYDCASRYFAPANGIDEDPVTGSIHTAIVPIWAERLAKNELVAYQASARGGVLHCKILDHERIEISGYAQLYMCAEIFVD